MNFASARIRDLIAYRIVTSLPKCYLKPDESQEEADLRYLYQIANELPGFLEERGFTAEPACGVKKSTSPLLNDDVKPYYRDYICGNTSEDYQSLHITFYDNSSRSYMEVTIRYAIRSRKQLRRCLSSEIDG